MSKFVAVASHSSLPGGRAEGTLEVIPPHVMLRLESQEISFPLSNLDIVRGGANNSLIFLTHPSRPEWSCYTRDKKILKALNNTEASAASKRVDHKGRREWLMFFVFVVGLVGIAWLLKEPLVSAATYMVPQSWETKAGDVIYQGVSSTVDIIEDQALTERFRTIVNPLLEVTKDTGYEFKFHLADESELNAFALPGGHIVVHSAVILKADRVEEVLGVLAHEMAHVTKRHTVRQIFSVLGLYFIFDIVFGNVAGTLAALTQAAPYLLQKGFSRAYEDQADAVGFDYLLKANINPSGMVSFFKRIEEEQNAIPGIATIEKHLTFLSTHPGTSERIATLESKLKLHSSQKYRDLGPEFESFKADLRKAVD